MKWYGSVTTPVIYPFAWRVVFWVVVDIDAFGLFFTQEPKLDREPLTLRKMDHLDHGRPLRSSQRSVNCASFLSASL